MQVAGRIMGSHSPRHVRALAVGTLAFSLLAAALIVLSQVHGVWIVVALAFAILYGWSNGVMTIVRGTVPAELFWPTRLRRCCSAGSRSRNSSPKAIAPRSHVRVRRSIRRATRRCGRSWFAVRWRCMPISAAIPDACRRWRNVTRVLPEPAHEPPRKPRNPHQRRDAPNDRRDVGNRRFVGSRSGSRKRSETGAAGPGRSAPDCGVARHRVSIPCRPLPARRPTHDSTGNLGYAEGMQRLEILARASAQGGPPANAFASALTPNAEQARKHFLQLPRPA